MNKALLDVGGRPILARILEALGPLVDERILLTNEDVSPVRQASIGQPDVAAPGAAEPGAAPGAPGGSADWPLAAEPNAWHPAADGLRLVRDAEPHAGVLPALAIGLQAASREVCLAVACDMPFVSTALFALLLDVQRADDADVVIVRTAGFLEPMHAVYRRQPVLAAIRAALARGERRMVSYFDAVRVREVDEGEWRRADPTGSAFFNVNTPDDLAEARRRAAGGPAAHGM